MSEGHAVTGINTRSDRFGGYRLERDLNNNIILRDPKFYQPEYWKTRAITPPQGKQPYESLRICNHG